ncbi:MAG: hypothetical protein SFU98_06800 [Leptospiraceae bacterium]|nr:hypothetical protein [Leptospiraceae bacterium]
MKVFSSIFILFILNCVSPSVDKADFTVKRKSNAKPIDSVIQIPFTTGKENLYLTHVELTHGIRDSIIGSGLFERIGQDGTEVWKLETEILDMNEPMVGLDFNIIISAKFKLTKQNQIVNEFSINAKGMATVSDEFVAVSRLKLAYSRAAENLISQLLDEIQKIRTNSNKKK